jgi:hypothetical protein
MPGQYLFLFFHHINISANIAPIIGKQTTAIKAHKGIEYGIPLLFTFYLDEI